jgi:hypothetical protein
VYSASNTAEFEAVVTSEMNYWVSPVAFEVRVGLSSGDLRIADTFRGDTDSKKEGLLAEFR